MDASETGYIVQGKANIVNDQLPGDLALAVEDLPLALQHELFRFIAPQGPLAIENIPAHWLYQYRKSAYSNLRDEATASTTPLDNDDETAPIINYDACSDTDDEESEEAVRARQHLQTASFASFYDELSDRCLDLNAIKPAAKSYWQTAQERLIKAPDDPTLQWSCPILRASLSREPSDNLLRFKLEPATIGSSTRFYRDFGWHRWIRVTVDPKLEQDVVQRSGKAQQQVAELLQRSFIIGGYSFRATLHKEGSIFLFAEIGPGLRPVYDFAFSQIPLALNPDMTIAKWIARFQLGLSKTVPTVTFEPSQIRRVPDVMSTSLPIGSKALQIIANALGFDWIPSCIRGVVHLPVLDADSVSRMEITWKLDFTSDNICFNFDMFDTSICPNRVDVTFEMASGAIARSKRFSIFQDQGELGQLIEVLEWPYEGPGCVMTDGCATISRGAAQSIRSGLKIPELPSVFQARIGGSKGLWSVNTIKENPSKEHWIEIRDSQYKYNCPSNFKYVFEVIRWSQRSFQSSLNYQTIRVLAHQGVPTSEFVDLMRQSTAERLSDLLEWDPELQAILRNAVEGYVHQNASRDDSKEVITFSSSSEGFKPQARFYGRGEREDYDLETHKDPKKQKAPLRLQPDTTPANLPYHRAAQILEMLDAGSTPRNNPYLTDRIAGIYVDEINKNRLLHVNVAKCVTLYVLADPIGCLKPGEVFAQFSSGFLDPETNERMTSLSGEVLITRDPCMLPTDIQKVNAVFKPELSSLYDVIVLPREGDIALCSLLAGGDYDGDMLRAIWEPRLVQPFNNAPQALALPKFDAGDYFKSDTRTINSVLAPLTVLDPPQLSESLASQLLTTLTFKHDYKRLHNLHSRICYMKSIQHDDALLLGGLYAIALDASKQGKILAPGCLEALEDQYVGEDPDWLKELQTEKFGERKRAKMSSPLKPKSPLKPNSTSTGIQPASDCPIEAIFRSLDDIEMNAAKMLEDRCKNVKGLFERDQDLVHLWEKWTERGVKDKAVAEDRKTIAAAVENCMIKYRQAAQTFGKAQSRMGTDLFVRSKRHKTLEEQDASRAFNDEVIRVRAEFYSTATAQDMKSPGLRANPSLVRKLKASCLYTECATTWRGQATKGYRLSMPWRLSFRDLNAVKADKVEHRTTPCKRRADLLGLEAPRIIKEAWDTLGSRAPKRLKVE